MYAQIKQIYYVTHYYFFGEQADSMNKNVLENRCLSPGSADGIYGRKSGTGMYFFRGL